VGLPAVELRPLRRADFPLLCRWPAEPLVARWWEEDPVLPTLRTLRVGPGTGPGADPTAVYLGVHDGKPFGLLQVYAFADAPESLAELTRVCPVPPGALSIDYLIGEPAARGRGLARGNEASWRALRRAGATWYAEGELVPVDPPDHVVHRFTGTGSFFRAVSRPATQVARPAAPGRRPVPVCPARRGWTW
jgi:aminoglycoside 6'-N-acetyltransferase